MTDFQPGFYQHFKGGLYLAHGIGEFGPSATSDTLFTTAKDHESLLGVGVYKSEHGGSFILNGHDRTGLPCVLYQALYGSGTFWVRELPSFTGNKIVEPGKEIERFRFLGTELPSELLG